MDFELKGKKAIVSAGGSGIGHTVVEEFIKQGVSISTCDIDKAIFKCVVNILRYMQRLLMLGMNWLLKNFAQKVLSF